MQTIDPALQKSVWARVMGSAPAQTPSRSPETELLRLLEREQHDAVLYRRLSRRLWGRDAALMRRLAARSRARFQTLHAVYFSETGQRAELPPPDFSVLPSLPEAIRDAGTREKEAAKDYAECAERWPALADGLRALAGDSDQCAGCLRVLLGRVL